MQPFVLLLAVLAACAEAPPEEARAPQEEPASLGASEPAPAAPGLYLARLDVQNLAFDLQWTSGPIDRLPSSAAPAARVEAMSAEAHDGFDRVVVEFGEGPFPGYHLAWEGEDPPLCEGGGIETLEVPHRLRFQVEASPGSVDATTDASLANVAGISGPCAGSEGLEWRMGVADSAAIRVVEMRRPTRLLVDVQHGSGGS